jgi:gamma-glutamyltranspeptidase/glutathione hydrolase
MPRQIIANTAAVAAGHPHGAAAGIEMLGDGGNAIDAAVAAMLAMCVVIPGSVGLGGYGGSAIVYRAGSKEHGARSRKAKADSRRPPADSEKSDVVAVDFDSRAPLDFEVGQVTGDPSSSYYGARSVTVPTVVAGLELLLRRFGTKSWREASQPAIRLAEEGFEFDAEHERHFKRCAPKFDRQSLESLFPSGAMPTIGDRWRQPELARLLERLDNEGPLSFYDGEVTKSIVRYLRQRGGILSEQDFRAYRPQLVAPVYVPCRGFELYTPPLPSGGIISLGIVRTVEPLMGAGSAEPWDAEYFHILTEAMKILWQERHSTLGDPDFVSISTEKLLSERAAEARAEQIKTRDGRSGKGKSNLSPRSQSSAPGFESSHTANVIAIDGDGNMISVTATQGWMYGSHLVVDGMGLVLNHGMSRFDYSPGHPNAPAPGKRMLHNMAPMIALRHSPPPLGGGVNGKEALQTALAFGMPGGPKIVSVTAQLALNAIVFGACPAESIAAPRLHSDGSEPLLVSSHMAASVIADLEQRGHAIRREEDMGGPVNVLAVDSQSGKIDIASGESTGAVAGF